MKLSRFFTGPAESMMFSTHSLTERVNTALKKGWSLYAGPAMTYDSERGIVVGQTVAAQCDGDYKGFEPFKNLPPIESKDVHRLGETIEEYDLLVGSPASLPVKLTHAQKKGWRLYGDPVVGFAGENDVLTAQAVVKASAGLLQAVKRSSGIVYDASYMKTLRGADDSAFCAEIEAALNDGWAKFGSPRLESLRPGVVAVQHMIRPDSME